MSSNQLIKIETNITAPPISNTFLRFFYGQQQQAQMDLEESLIKPAPRTDKEVLIKSAAVIRRIMIPIKNRK
jgi:hypothetical protein